MRLLGLDTEWIIVPFSSKGMNHMVYLAHVATDVWRVLSFSDITLRFNDHAATQFRDRQMPHPIISRRAVRKRHRPRIKSQKTARSVNMLNHVTTISVRSAASALQSQEISPR